MELNKDEIIKALECCSSSEVGFACERGCPYFGEDYDTCPCTEDPNFIIKNALALINELTAKNDAVSEECCNLLAKVRKLSEENERLNASCTELAQKLHDANEENISVCLKNFDLICENNRIKADTVRKMQELIYERLDISVEGYSTEEVKSDVCDIVDRIAKEILEEYNAH